jgi:hypothetical protein
LNLRLLIVGLVLWTSVASAAAGELVVLIAPGGSPPELREALQRVRGELMVHGFSIRIVEAETVPSIRELETLADGVVLIGSSMPSPGDQPAFLPDTPPPPAGDRLGKVEVWISDRVTGKTSKRTIALEESYDAPTVLAVRTVELLRSSLQEEQPEKAHSVEGAHPERAAGAVTELKKSQEQGPFFYFGLAAAGGLSLPDGTPSLAPAATAGLSLASFGVELSAIGPLVAATTSATSGTFDSISMTILAEPFWAPFRQNGHTIYLFPSIGGTYLEVRGTASGDYVGQADGAWVVSTGGGLGGHVRINRHFGVVSELRALVLLPRPVVQIGPEEKEIGFPLLTAALGLRLTL